MADAGPDLGGSQTIASIARSVSDHSMKDQTSSGGVLALAGKVERKVGDVKKVFGK